MVPQRTADYLSGRGQLAALVLGVLPLLLLPQSICSALYGFVGECVGVCVCVCVCVLSSMRLLL
jgi:hypothetical protein